MPVDESDSIEDCSERPYWDGALVHNWICKQYRNECTWRNVIGSRLIYPKRKVFEGLQSILSHTPEEQGVRETFTLLLNLRTLEKKDASVVWMSRVRNVLHGVPASQATHKNKDASLTSITSRPLLEERGAGLVCSLSLNWCTKEIENKLLKACCWGSYTLQLPKGRKEREVSTNLIVSWISKTQENISIDRGSKSLIAEEGVVNWTLVLYVCTGMMMYSPYVLYSSDVARTQRRKCLRGTKTTLTPLERRNNPLV